MISACYDDGLPIQRTRIDRVQPLPLDVWGGVYPAYGRRATLS